LSVPPGLIRAYITLDHGRNAQERRYGIKRKALCSARGFGLRSSGNLCGLPQQGDLFPAEHFGAKTHSRVNLRLSEGTVSLSSVAQAFEQCLCPVIEILPKFRKGALCHFIYRAFTREIAANSDELNQGLNFSNFIRIQHRIWPDLPRWP
jgi:hypothetical protein